MRPITFPLGNFLARKENARKISKRRKSNRCKKKKNKKTTKTLQKNVSLSRAISLSRQLNPLYVSQIMVEFPNSNTLESRSSRPGLDLSMEEDRPGSSIGGGESSSSKPTSSFLKSGDRQVFVVELRPGETTYVSWKKLMKDANKANKIPSKSAPDPQPVPRPNIESRVASVSRLIFHCWLIHFVFGD